MKSNGAVFSRREFLLNTLKVSGQITLAHSTVLVLGMTVGSAAAGAKCSPEGNSQITSSPAGPGIRMYQRWVCTGGTWVADGGSWCQQGGTPVTCP